MDKKNIFRKEVFEQRLSSSLGPVLITLPIRTAYLSWLFLILVFGLTLYLIFANYTDHMLIPGYIDVNPAMTQVYPLKSGTVLKRYVEVGQVVKRGQPLLAIETGQLVKSKQQILTKLTNLEKEMKRDIKEKKSKLRELKSLVKQHYLSKMEWTNFKKTLHQTQQQLAELSLRRINLMLEQQYQVLAPIDAKIMQVAVSEGQGVRPDMLLVQLMPLGARWSVTLLAPMSAIRFVKLNQRIQLRYDAYPYLQYGTSPAVIKAVSPVISSKDEPGVPIHMKQAFYQIQAALLLDKPKLYHGMTLQAALSMECRPLWRRLLHL